MTPERWQQVKELLASAVEQEVEERSAFLDRACAGDEGFRREVNAALGEKDKAFVALNKAYENRQDFVMYLKVDPRLDRLRDDQRFQDLMQRVGY